MSTHSFTLQVAGIPTEGRYEEALFEVGCDDALVVVTDGRLSLDFDREASSFDEAVASAVFDVGQAGGKVVKVERIFD
jgi:hypothetical protein